MAGTTVSNEALTTPVTAMSITDSDVSKPCAEYTSAEEMRRVGRTLMGGTAAMRAAGETYLPKNTAESVNAYTTRLSKSVLYNAFRRAVNNLVGKVFDKPISLLESDEAMEEWWEDIDLQGNSGDVFARMVFEKVMAEGLAYILTDYPVVPEGQEPVTVGELKTTGLRPYWVHILPQQVIGWRTELVGGIQRLTQVRILETVTEPKGLFDETSIEQVRVLVPGGWQIWRPVDDDSGRWQLYDAGQTSLDFIPLTCVYATRKGHFQSDPPLQDLADLNVKHWQSLSMQDHILDYCRFPILFARNLGLDEGADLKIGPNGVIIAESENAELKHVEHTGASIDSGRSSIQDLENRMAILSLEPMLQSSPGTLTATKTSIDSSSAASSLMAMAVSLKDALEQSLTHLAAYAPEMETGSVHMDFDFVLNLSSADATVLLQTYQAGAISREQYCSELQRRAVLSDDYDIEADGVKIDEEKSSSLEAQAAVMKKLGMVNTSNSARPGAKPTNTPPAA